MLILTIVGVAALGMAFMPSLSKKIKISYAIFYVIAGFGLYLIFKDLPAPLFSSYPNITRHLTELAVIISIMGTGLKIDQPFSFKGWATPFRLVSITMLLSIIFCTLLGKYVLGFDWGTSFLLGAVLAPTDPVLASDVQVGPPLEKHHDNVRFSLTAEAGMNDGMAFPFVWFAIAVATAEKFSFADVGEWFLVDVLYKIIAAVICGLLVGRGIAYVVFEKKEKFVVVKDSFIAIAVTLIVFALTELIHAYGFIAVFVCAITIRNYELNNKFHKYLHEFTDQIERILVAIILLLFGGSLAVGVLEYLTWEMAVIGIFIVILVRPVAAYLGLWGNKLHPNEKWGISFFGIKGIGSFYYLSFALLQTTFNHQNELWALVSFVVLLSIVLHGLTATRVMEKIKKKHTKKIPGAQDA